MGQNETNFSRLMSAADEVLGQEDPQILDAVRGERRRQHQQIELIASENYVSAAVLAAQGSILTNKYAEGYPEHRYYGGCEFVDIIERLARERAQNLFSAEYANVQPHSGSQANGAAYLAFLEPGDTVLAMNLGHGGHLTHGARFNFSGQFYKFVHYGVDPTTEMLDYATIRSQAREHKPRMIVAGASAYPRIIDFGALRAIADEIGAVLVVDMAHIAGLVAAGVHPSPIAHSHAVTSTTHKTLRGPRAGLILCHKEYASKVDKAVFPGLQGGPLMHIIAAKAVAFHEAMQPGFKQYAQRIVSNSQRLAGSLTAGGLRVVSGGTDNHIVLVDVRDVQLTGQQAEDVLHTIGITVNKNLIPFDPAPPRVTSGIRLGTPAITTRGFAGPEMDIIADCICRALRAPSDTSLQKSLRARTRDLCEQYPLPMAELT